jgi:hypothetical protein
MPSVLETPATMRQERRQQDVPEGTAVVVASTALQPSRGGFMARLVARLTGVRKRPVQPYHWNETAPRPTEMPMERLARECPQLFLLAHCG